MKIYIGIDPGVGGGLAAITASGGVRAYMKMPDTEKGVLFALKAFAASEQYDPFAILEFVRSSPQMGVTSSFTFGRGYGGLRMALIANEIPFDEAVPRKWQQAMGCLSKGDKHVTKRRAEELFPGLRVTNYVADALLIAEYARRHYGLAS